MDPAPAPRRRPPVFAIAATFVGTLCLVAFAAVIALNHGTRGALDRIAGVAQASCPIATSPAPRNETLQGEDCRAAQRVQALLLSSGAHGANVSVSTQETGSLTGPTELRKVTVQVFADAQLLREWRPADMARAVAAVAGTDLRHVSIVDDRMVTLFDGTVDRVEGASMHPSAAPSTRSTSATARRIPAPARPLPGPDAPGARR